MLDGIWLCLFIFVLDAYEIDISLPTTLFIRQLFPQVHSPSPFSSLSLLKPPKMKNTLPIATFIGIASAQKPLTGVFVPPELTYLLPLPYTGDINTNFVEAKTSNSSINGLFASARNATFYAYDAEFYDILGKEPMITTIPSDHAHEAGVWVITSHSPITSETT
jgi:hypothetical protein